MTKSLKATLARLVAANDVESLEALLAETTNRADRQQITLAVSHAVRRSIRAFGATMSPAPVVKAEPFLTVPAETLKLWGAISAL
jgi:hypothetical protein